MWVGCLEYLVVRVACYKTTPAGEREMQEWVDRGPGPGVHEGPVTRGQARGDWGRVGHGFENEWDLGSGGNGWFK